MALPWGVCKFPQLLLGGNFQPLEGSADVALIQPDLVPKKIKESKDDQEDVAAGTHKRGCD